MSAPQIRSTLLQHLIRDILVLLVSDDMDSSRLRDAMHMPSTKRSEVGSGEKPWPIYHRSKHLSPPVVYVETRRSWKSYRADGTLLGQGRAPIPETILSHIEKIDQAEAYLLLSARWQEAGHEETEELLDSVPEAEDDPLHSTIGLDGHTAARLRPRRWRYVARDLTPWVLIGLGIWWIYRAVLPGRGWPAYAGDVYMVIWCVVWLPRIGLKTWKSASQETIVVTDKEIIKHGANERASIALSELDLSRSSNRSLTDLLSGRQYLYAIGGNRLCLCRWAYARADVRVLLETLGVRQEHVA